jgi:hypothetical protein
MRVDGPVLSQLRAGIEIRRSGKAKRARWPEGRNRAGILGSFSDLSCVKASEQHICNLPFFFRAIAMMITLDDCLAFCGLSEPEVRAIAEHEHVPEIAAAGLGQYLLNRQGGADTIRDMILDDIAAAHARRDQAHARELAMVLRHFLATHPEAHAVPLPGRAGAEVHCR